jgi:hypothetical protein
VWWNGPSTLGNPAEIEELRPGLARGFLGLALGVSEGASSDTANLHGKVPANSEAARPPPGDRARNWEPPVPKGRVGLAAWLRVCCRMFRALVAAVSQQGNAGRVRKQSPLEVELSSIRTTVYTKQTRRGLCRLTRSTQ